ncbi:hypothetical protein Efla_001782 [Eimeria flavescens]
MPSAKASSPLQQQHHRRPQHPRQHQKGSRCSVSSRWVVLLLLLLLLSCCCCERAVGATFGSGRRQQASCQATQLQASSSISSSSISSSTKCCCAFIGGPGPLGSSAVGSCMSSLGQHQGLLPAGATSAAAAAAAAVRKCPWGSRGHFAAAACSPGHDSSHSGGCGAANSSGNGDSSNSHQVETATDSSSSSSSCSRSVATSSSRGRRARQSLFVGPQLQQLQQQQQQQQQVWSSGDLALAAAWGVSPPAAPEGGLQPYSPAPRLLGSSSSGSMHRGSSSSLGSSLTSRTSSSSGRAPFVSHYSQLYSSPDLRRYLQRKGLSFSEDAEKFVVTYCPFCPPHKNKRDNLNKLIFFRNSGNFYCHRCGNKGSLFDFKIRTGDLSSSSTTGDLLQQQHQQQQQQQGQAASIYHWQGDRSGVFDPRLQQHRQQQALDMYAKQLAAAAAAAASPAGSSSSNSIDDCHTRVLRYLTEKRGLKVETLLEFGVGSGVFYFPPASGEGPREPHCCVTFPWTPAVHPAAASNAAAASLSSPIPPRHSAAAAAAAAAAARPLPIRLKVRSIDDKSCMRLEPFGAGGAWGLFGADVVLRQLWNSTSSSSSSKGTKGAAVFAAAEPQSAAAAREESGGGDAICVAEGEFDAMSIWQETGMPTVSVPLGANSLPPQLLPFFERFRSIYLWFDEDMRGREGADLWASKLGISRCHLVRCTDELLQQHAEQQKQQQEPPQIQGETEGEPRVPKDANECLLSGFDLQAMLLSARRVPHQQILTFQDLRARVLHELVEPGKLLLLRLPLLLLQLLRGFRRGELSIWTGGTGAGKTTALSQLSLDFCAQGVPTLWGSFEVNNVRLLRMMLLQFSGGVAGGGRKEFARVADAFAQLPLWLLRFHGSTSVEEVLDAMDYAVYAHDVGHVVIDNLQFMLSGQGRQGDIWDLQNAAIAAFRSFATQRNVHLSIVVHPRKEDDNVPLGLSSVFGSVKSTQEADNVVILQRQAAAAGSSSARGEQQQQLRLLQHGLRRHRQRQMRYSLEVRKNRFSGELGSVPYVFDPQSLLMRVSRLQHGGSAGSGDESSSEGSGGTAAAAPAAAGAAGEALDFGLGNSSKDAAFNRPQERQSLMSLCAPRGFLAPSGASVASRAPKGLWLPSRKQQDSGFSLAAARRSPPPLPAASGSSSAAAGAAGDALAQGMATAASGSAQGPPASSAAAAAAASQHLPSSSQLPADLPIALLRQIAAALPLQSPIKTAGAGRTKALLLEDLQAAADASPKIKACIDRMLQQHQRMQQRQQQQQQQQQQQLVTPGAAALDVATLQQQTADNAAAAAAAAAGSGSSQQLAQPLAPLTRRVPLVQYLEEHKSSYAETARLHSNPPDVCAAPHGQAAASGLPSDKQPAAAAAAAAAEGTAAAADGSGSAVAGLATPSVPSQGDSSCSGSSSGSSCAAEGHSSCDEVYVQVPIHSTEERLSADFVLIDTPEKARKVEALLRKLLAFLQQADAKREHQQQQQQQQQQEQQDQQLVAEWQPEAGGYQQPEGLIAMGLDVETTGLVPHSSSLRLVQVALPELPCLVYDVAKLPPSSLSGLLLLLKSPLITKVMHHAKFDIGFLSHFLLQQQQHHQQDQQQQEQQREAGLAANAVAAGGRTPSSSSSSSNTSDGWSSSSSGSMDSSIRDSSSSSSMDSTIRDSSSSSSSDFKSRSAEYNERVSQALGGLSPPFFDTLLASRLLEAGQIHFGFSLAQVAERTLGVFLDKQMQASDWSAAELAEEQLLYAARDAAVLLPLHDRLSRRLRQHQLLRVADLEHRTLPAVVSMERTGMALDVKCWDRLAERLRKEQQEAADALLQQLGETAETINLNSQRQILEALRRVGVSHAPGAQQRPPPPRREPAGAAAAEVEADVHALTDTGDDTLSRLGHFPAVAALRNFRRASKAVSAFVERLPRHVDPVTGRIHAQLHQCGAGSGRFSCDSPNLQQVPREAAFRRCFVPASPDAPPSAAAAHLQQADEAGHTAAAAPTAAAAATKGGEKWKFLIADFSQIELRIAADIAEDEKMIEAYQQGRDLHRLTASLLLSKPEEQLSKADRQLAKAVNFGLIYGISVPRFRAYALSAYGVSLTPAEARAFHANFFKHFKGITRWHQQQKRLTPLETRTRSGRRASFDAFSFTKALNYPVQGTSADITKESLALLLPRLSEVEGQLVMCVHDEIIVQLPERHQQRGLEILVSTMEEAGGLFLRHVPCKAEGRIGDSWADKP